MTGAEMRRLMERGGITNTELLDIIHSVGGIECAPSTISRNLNKQAGPGEGPGTGIVPGQLAALVRLIVGLKNARLDPLETAEEA